MDSRKNMLFYLRIIVYFIAIVSFPTFALSQDIYEKDDTFYDANFLDKSQVHNFHDAGDEDWCKFYGISGEFYTIKASDLQSDCDVILELYGNDKKIALMKKNDKGPGEDETLEWKCSAEGLYYIRATNSNPNHVPDNNAYTLHCDYPYEYDAYENDDTFEQARTVFVHSGAQHHNFHDKGDEDWIKFSGSKDKWYIVDIVNPGSDCDAVIEIFDTDGITLLKSEDGASAGHEEDLSWKCPQDGIYYVRIRNCKPEIFGENTAYDLRVFYPELFPGSIKGQVTNFFNSKEISGAGIKVGDKEVSTDTDGVYRIECIEKGTYTLKAEARGYEIYEAEVEIIETEPSYHDVSMIPILTLSEAIFSLQIIAGMNAAPERIKDIPDANKDGKIGLTEAICILQYIAKLRP